MAKQKRSGDMETAEELMKRSGVKYYTSILDFEKSDLEWLVSLRARIITFLKRQHGYNPAHGDVVNMYFHFPYNWATATVHLHIRMNQGVLPVEDVKSINLNDIIGWLQQHDNIYGLIMQRYSGKGIGGPTGSTTKLLQKWMVERKVPDGVKIESDTMDITPYCGTKRCLDPKSHQKRCCV